MHYYNYVYVSAIHLFRLPQSRRKNCYVGWPIGSTKRNTSEWLVSWHDTILKDKHKVAMHYNLITLEM